MTRRVQALVVGGGPSGLAVAYSLQGDTIVVEKESSVGGLCRSLRHGQGVFDVGGHSFHTPHPEVHDLVQELLPGGLFKQRRDARVYSHGTLIPYPFQKYYERLPDKNVIRECEEGLRAVQGNGPPPQNFQEYIIRKFGPGIAEHFMLPYNRKLWARDIRRISCEWTSERVAGAKGAIEKFETRGGKRKPLQPDTQVGYPHQGGYEEIYQSFVPHLPAAELDSNVEWIDPIERIAVVTSGARYRWEFLISTMPLPILVRVIEGAPQELKEAADRLEYMSLRVELLLTGRPLDTSIQRIYVADPVIPPHKIALNHNSSEHLRARQQHAIMAEVSHSPEKVVDPDGIAPRTISFLCEIGVLRSPADVIWTGHVDVKFAYPVYTHGRPALVARIKDWLARHHIYTLGRFGEWEYINSDKCVMKGLLLGKGLRERYPSGVRSSTGTPHVRT